MPENVGPRYLRRVPIHYTAEGEEHLRTFIERYDAADPALVNRVLGELEAGFPVDDPDITVDVFAVRHWVIWHPWLEGGNFETDPEFDPEFEAEVVDINLNPVAVKVFGRLEFLSHPGSDVVSARFLCDLCEISGTEA